MKITLLTKRITTNVIAQTAAEALRLFETSEEVGDAQVNAVSVRRVLTPNAPYQTALFAATSGFHVLGNFDGLLEHLKDNPDAVTVWEVMLDVEYVVDYDMPKQDTSTDPSIAGSIGGQTAAPAAPGDDVTDPNDRADPTSRPLNVPPVDGVKQSSVTEGDI